MRDTIIKIHISIKSMSLHAIIICINTLTQVTRVMILQFSQKIIIITIATFARAIKVSAEKIR